MIERFLENPRQFLCSFQTQEITMFDQEVSVIIQYLIIICLTLVTRNEKSFLSISCDYGLLT